jgi:glycosyltransferase involved in cell wall biosynthesis
MKVSVQEDAAETSPMPPMPARRGTPPAQLRVGLVCDFLEEQWPSMDLMGDMLAHYLQAGDGGDIQAVQLRPALRSRFSRLPILGQRSFSRNTDRLINRFVDYPNWLRKHGAYDVFHLVDHSYSHLIHRLPPASTVVTCHDLDTFRSILEPEREPRPGWFRAMARRILDGFQKAAHVISVSESTRNELLRLGLFPPDRITVIPNGVHPSCSPELGAADHELEALLGTAPNAPLLLSVGNTMRRKRLDVLLRVFAAIRKEIPSVQLLRVGGLAREQQQLTRELGIGDKIVTLPFLERPMLAAMYRRAALLLQTSDAEGFGLPLVEAMACGCPVVASDIPIFREVGEAAASYCAVGEIGAWSDTIVRLLSERAQNPSAWSQRRQAGITRAAHFSWAENARRTADIYRSLCAQGEIRARVQ